MGEARLGADAGDRLKRKPCGATTYDQGVPDDYEPRCYWESLISKQYDLSGVSHAELPTVFAKALYRQLDRTVDLEAPPARRVLDIGSGTGHWLRYWRRRGAEPVGLDLTEHAVAELARTLADVPVVLADVSQGVPFAGSFDVVSAMNVLLHIVDEQQWNRALRNLGDVLNANGRLLAIEPMVVHHWWGGPVDASSSSRSRTIGEWRAALAGVGLELMCHRPVTAILANPVDTRSRLLFRALAFYWRALPGVLRRSGRAAPKVVWILEQIDRVCVACRWSPSAKLLVIGRRAL